MSFRNRMAYLQPARWPRRKAAIAHFIGLGCLLALLNGCAGNAPQTAPVIAKPIPESPVVSSEVETLSPDELRVISDNKAGQAYVLGPDDMIAVSVYLHPELTAPITASGSNNGNSGGGALVTSDGTVELPLIGSVKVGGLTIDQAQALITNNYAQYIPNPEVAIELIQAQSLRYYLLGAFTTPGIKYPVHPLTLLEALALGGTVEIANADLQQAFVAQNNVKLPVDLGALLLEGDMSQNIPLASGDVIMVPSNLNENAFVFGAVTKPGAVLFESGKLSLLQALAVSGIDLPSLTDARLSEIHIIRSNGRTGEFLIVNATMIMSGQAQSFDLQPGDIIFVPPTEVASWNQVLTQLLPSLQTISAILNPFVSIKYLRQ